MGKLNDCDVPLYRYRCTYNATRLTVGHDEAALVLLAALCPDGLPLLQRRLRRPPLAVGPLLPVL